MGIEKWLKENEVYVKFKHGPLKASQAELAIKLVKRRLYTLLNGIGDENWVKYLPTVTDYLNSRHLKKIGFITPKSINNKQDGVLIDQAREKHHIENNVIHFDQQIKNIQEYSKKKNVLKPGDYVFLDLNQKFKKGNFYFLFQFRNSHT